MKFTLLVGISNFLLGGVGFAIGIWAGWGGSGGGVPLGLSGGTLFLGRHTGLAPCRVFHFVLISLSLCDWWCLICGTECGSSHGKLYIGNHWSRIITFPIVGKRVWVNFGPCVQRNWFTSPNGWFLRALVFESFPWMIFPGYGAVKFLFPPAMSRCSFDESLWWDECIPMLFALLVGLSINVQGDVSFSILIWAGWGGSGGGVPLGLSGATLFLGRYTGLAPCQFLHFFPDLTFEMCLMMAALWSYVWDFTWYALCRQSLKQSPLISRRRQACSGWYCTLCPDKFISSSVSLSFHSLSVDLFWTLDLLVFLAFFLGGFLLCSLLQGFLGVLVSVTLNVLNLGDIGPGCKSIFLMLLIISLKSITSQYIASMSVGYIMQCCTQSLNCLSVL